MDMSEHVCPDAVAVDIFACRVLWFAVMADERSNASTVLDRWNVKRCIYPKLHRSHAS
jgi:hypothetical protein